MSSSETSATGKLKSGLPILPPLKMGGRRTDGVTSPNLYSEKNHQPQPKRPERRSKPVSHRFLSPSDWALLAHGIGGLSDHEGHKPAHPKCWYWGPKGMPEGLYKDVVRQRSKYTY